MNRTQAQLQKPEGKGGEAWSWPQPYMGDRRF